MITFAVHALSDTLFCLASPGPLLIPTAVRNHFHPRTGLRAASCSSQLKHAANFKSLNHTPAQHSSLDSFEGVLDGQFL